jgi:hypothetical protein
MAKAGRTVVRMFTCDQDTVRWETRIAEPHGLELKVFGPGALRREYSFADALSLTEYQVQYEQELVSSGYRLLPHSDRRAGYERRRSPRNTEDRRRA